jgi:hypothetical protein
LPESAACCQAVAGIRPEAVLPDPASRRRRTPNAIRTAPKTTAYAPISSTKASAPETGQATNTIPTAASAAARAEPQRMSGAVPSEASIYRLLRWMSR